MISAPRRCHLSHFAKAYSPEVLSPSLYSLLTPNPAFPFGEGAKPLLKADPETCGVHGPGRAPWATASNPAGHSSVPPGGSPRPPGRHRLAGPSLLGLAAAGLRGDGSPRSGWGRGPAKGPADAASAPLPWPGPPRCRGAGGINQDNEAAACHAPRGH